MIPPRRSRHESWAVDILGGLAGGGLTAEGRPDPVGGVPPGLVQRVQRRLTADGRVAADPGGLRTAVTETLGEDGILLPEASLAPVVRAVGDELTGLGRWPRCSPTRPSPMSWSTAPPTSGGARWRHRTGRRAVCLGGGRCRDGAAGGALGCAWTRRGPGSTPASRAASGSTRCCHRWPPTVRWSPSGRSRGGGSSSAT